MNRTSAFVAFLTLAAWANVQIMACCWSFSTPVKATAQITPVSGEHACCHRHTEAEAVSVPVTDGSVLISCAHAATCGGKHEAPALQSFSPSLDIAAATVVQIFHASISIPVHSLSATPVRNTGPPVFLVLQRLLV